MVKEDLVEEVTEVKRLNERYKIAMVCGRKILYVFSEYAPQKGKPEEKKKGVF